MSDVPSADDLLGIITDYIKDPSQPSTNADRPVRLATVDPAYTSGSPKVTFDGEATMSGKVYPTTCPVAAGDRVVMIPAGIRAYVIVGVLTKASGGVPAGNIEATARRTAPDGWLLCDGSAVSRATYPALFAALNPVIGTATMTIAAPAVVTKTAHGLQTGQMVYLTTTGALPTGLAVNTAYYAVRIDANTFNLATSLANALAGTKITTTGSQSGTHTLSASWGVGDGSTTFNVPNAKGSALVAVDTAQTEFAAPGQTGGEKTHLLTLPETPAHTHTVIHTTGAGATASGDAIPPHNSTPNANNVTTSSAGGGGAHNNLQPYLAINYIIKT